MRIYGQIKNIQDLQKLQEEANVKGLIAVRVASPTSAYRYDDKQKTAVSLKPEEVKIILNIDDEQYETLMSSIGQAELEEIKEEADVQLEKIVITADPEEFEIEDSVEEEQEETSFQEESVQTVDLPGEVRPSEEEPVQEPEETPEVLQEDPRVAELEAEIKTLRVRNQRLERTLQEIQLLIENNII
ncbi:hypothetical protein BK011_05835 [Tenericutes bacterium MZ-XQ]|jgi:hypothetical protein|nr:hypothetical protein BK011_05835 [Tenericutes bacterium MZ-XQ]